jgi:hypothetical protein
MMMNTTQILRDRKLNIQVIFDTDNVPESPTGSVVSQTGD